MIKKKQTRSTKASVKSAKEVNKSAAIREILTTDPEGKPQAIANTLQEQGVQVSAAFVSQVKLKMKQRATAGPKRVNNVGIGQFAGSDLMEAKRLIDKLGVEKARAAVELLAKLS